VNRKIVTEMVLLAILFLAGIVNAGQNLCFPDWDAQTPIIIDTGVGRHEFAPGNSFLAEANNKYSRDCNNYLPAVLTWQGLKNNIPTRDIVFSDIHAKKTTATVVAGAQTGDIVTIRATLSFANQSNGLRSEREINVFIVSKPAAPEILLNYDPAIPFIISLKSFKVGIEGSKTLGSGNNFIRNCSFVLKDEQKNIVSSDQKETSFGKVMPKANLMANNPGNYEITAICSDAFGTTGIVTEIIPVGLSDKKSNTPYLIVNKTLNCDIGNCAADFSQTNDFEKSLKVWYLDISNGDNRNLPLFPCGARACNFSVAKEGNYKFKLIAKFLLSTDSNGFHYSDPSETVVAVYATTLKKQVQTTSTARKVQPQPAISRQQVTPAATAAPQSIASSNDGGCGENGFGCKTSPGLGSLVGIFALIIFARKK